MPTDHRCNENPNLLVPSFLPQGDILGWNLTSMVNPVTKRKEYTYTVCVQTDGAFASSDNSEFVLVKCDGPCGNKIASNHLISMGKCDHRLCKACFGLFKNTDGSYGCSNFSCWSEPQKDFRKEKAIYNKIINKQIFRAQKLKKYGEDMKPCKKTDLPKTPAIASNSERSAKSNSSSSASSSTATDY
uniref:Zf-C3HC4 domain-containing protein n=1 Tax=Caenorhabditis tropicalis TaxID=1561998 RepID=A0A1I7UY27_9PELO